jgi:hypothetical protein
MGEEIWTMFVIVIAMIVVAPSMTEAAEINQALLL